MVLDRERLYFYFRSAQFYRARGKMPKTIAELTKNGRRRVVKKLYKAMKSRERAAQGQRPLYRLLALQNLLSLEN